MTQAVKAASKTGSRAKLFPKHECSSSMRKSHPVGTKFLILAKVINKEGGTDFLYCHYNSEYRVLSNNEVAAIISRM